MKALLAAAVVLGGLLTLGCGSTEESRQDVYQTGKDVNRQIEDYIFEREYEGWWE